MKLKSVISQLRENANSVPDKMKEENFINEIDIQ